MTELDVETAGMLYRQNFFALVGCMLCLFVVLMLVPAIDYKVCGVFYPIKHHDGKPQPQVQVRQLAVWEQPELPVIGRISAELSAHAPIVDKPNALVGFAKRLAAQHGGNRIRLITLQNQANIITLFAEVLYASAIEESP